MRVASLPSAGFRTAATIRWTPQGNLQHARYRPGRTSLRIAEQLRALPGAQCHLSPDRQEARAGAQHGIRRSSTRSSIPGDPLTAIPLPERFFGGGGSSHRGFPENQAGPRDPTTGLPLGRHGPAVQSDRTALSADRRQYRRRALSRCGQHLFQPEQLLAAPEAAGYAGFRLHGPCGGLRHTLSDAGGTVARGLGVQHQRSDIFRIQGHAAGSDQRRA